MPAGCTSRRIFGPRQSTLFFAGLTLTYWKLDYFAATPATATLLLHGFYA